MIQGIFRKDKGRAITHERIRREKRVALLGELLALGFGLKAQPP